MGQEYQDFVKKVRDFLIQRISESIETEPQDLDYRILGKAKRDGRLIASVKAEREGRLAQRDFTTSSIISSAGLLREADIVFREELGNPYMVLSIAAVSFLLTLNPQVSMNFGTLRSVLFDTALTTRLSSAQLQAYRLISISGQWDIPWSRRGTLQRELRETLYEEARLRGEKASTLRDKVVSIENPDYTATIIAKLLDRMAITPQIKRDLTQTKAELLKTQQQLEVLRASKKSTVAKGKRQRYLRRRRQ